MSGISGWLSRWVHWVTQHAAWVLGLFLIATLLAGWVVSERFQVNSKLGDLIDQKLSLIHI